MKKVILYGGSFNPPTIAHQVILQACLSRAATSDGEVWLVLSGSRADKQIDVSRQQRIELAQALYASTNIPDRVSFKIETVELDGVGQTQTYKTHQHLQALYPSTQFEWVFGSDSVSSMSSWTQGSWLAENLRMLVIPRPGYEKCILPSKAHLFSVDVPEVSSTEVRKCLTQGQSIVGLVPPEVRSMLE